MKEFFKVENLCFGYIKKPLCLKDINFSAGKNDKILVIALDDSGKTSMIKTLSGFDDKFFGKVFLHEKEIRQIPDEEKKISIVFDNPVLVNGSIDKNLNFLFETINKPVPSDEEKIELLKKVGLTFPLKEKIYKLGKFEQFKFCLLRSIIKESEIIFIDDIWKNNFSDEELKELQELLKDHFSDKLVFVFASDKSFVKNRAFFDEFKPSKVLYLSYSNIFEYKTIDEFLGCSVNLDACAFNLELFKKEGYCIFQDGSFYLVFDDKNEIKIDKSLNENFEKLKLANNDNEDIILVYKNDLKIDFLKNNDFNKLLESKQLMIFSKLDGSKVL